VGRIAGVSVVVCTWILRGHSGNGGPRTKVAMRFRLRTLLIVLALGLLAATFIALGLFPSLAFVRNWLLEVPAWRRSREEYDGTMKEAVELRQKTKNMAARDREIATRREMERKNELQKWSRETDRYSPRLHIEGIRTEEQYKMPNSRASSPPKILPSN
jgi:hypothetical protein